MKEKDKSIAFDKIKLMKGKRKKQIMKGLYERKKDKSIAFDKIKLMKRQIITDNRACRCVPVRYNQR